MACLTSAKYDFFFDVLRQGANEYTPNADPEADGTWTSRQDPDSGEIERVWSKVDDPSTEDDESEGTRETYPCQARGILDGGIRVAGTTERFSDIYEGVDYVRLWYPASVVLSRRDRITNIRDRNGRVIWYEEETRGGKPTVFSVNGVTPVIAPFVGHIENITLLERVEAQ